MVFAVVVVTEGQIYHYFMELNAQDNLLRCVKWRGQECAIFTSTWFISALSLL